MRHLSAFNRLKFLQTFAVSGATTILYTNEAILDPDVNVHVLAGLGAFSVVTLFAFGEYFRRVVGFIYFRPEDATVRFSHLTFWGQRNDFDVAVEDVVPISDTPEDATKFAWKIHFYDSRRRKLIVCSRFGGVKHRESLKSIFGSEAFNSKS